MRLKKGYKLPRKTGRFLMEGTHTSEYGNTRTRNTILDTLTAEDKKNARCVIKMLLGESKNIKYAITEKNKHGTI